MITTHTIDAKGESLGRVASKVAKVLLGKTTPDFTKNKVADVKVIIINASQTKMTEKRKMETLHERYSGYPGGLRTRTNVKIIEKFGWKELYRLAIFNMLPNNKHRAILMKRLTINE
jgi:large subunit ribosomal protein L13